LEHGQSGVGEDAVVAVAGKQLALPVGDRRGVQAPDAANDQPAGDVVGFAAGGERGEGYFGGFGVGDQALFVFVPDRVPLSGLTLMAMCGRGQLAARTRSSVA